MKIADYSVMLNKKSVLDCVEEEDVAQHEREINLFEEKLCSLVDNYDCKVIVEYADPKNRHRKRELHDCKLHDVLSMVEHYDIFNGGDIISTNTFYFGLRLFGVPYEYEGRDYITETHLLIVPYDKTGRSLDVVSPFVGESVKFNRIKFHCEPNREET